jgi:excisionase family DNA binding protein
MNEKPLIGVLQGARMLGVCTRTIYRMFNDGQLRRIKVRGSTKISVEELEKYLIKPEGA